MSQVLVSRGVHYAPGGKAGDAKWTEAIKDANSAYNRALIVQSGNTIKAKRSADVRLAKVHALLTDAQKARLVEIIRHAATRRSIAPSLSARLYGRSKYGRGQHRVDLPGSAAAYADNEALVIRIGYQVVNRAGEDSYGDPTGNSYVSGPIVPEAGKHQTIWRKAHNPQGGIRGEHTRSNMAQYPNPLPEVVARQIAYLRRYLDTTAPGIKVSDPNRCAILDFAARDGAGEFMRSMYTPGGSGNSGLLRSARKHAGMLPLSRYWVAGEARPAAIHTGPGRGRGNHILPLDCAYSAWAAPGSRKAQPAVERKTGRLLAADRPADRKGPDEALGIRLARINANRDMVEFRSMTRA